MADSNLPSPPATRALSGAQIARAASLLMAGTILTKLIALARETILSGMFGAGVTYEAFVAALRPADTLFFVVAGGAIGSAFIPTFAAYLEKAHRDEAWQMASAVLTLLTLLVAALAGLMAIFARPIVARVLAPGFTADPVKFVLTVRLMRIMLLSPAIFGISGLFMGMLNTHQRFLLPALAPALYNVGIILGAVVLTPLLGSDGLAWGMVLGALLHLLIQVPGFIGLNARFRPSLAVQHPGVREVARLMGPRVLGLAIVQINFWVNTNLASSMEEGSVAALQRAFYLMLLPQGIIAQSVANAVFPTFSIHVARGEMDALQATLGRVLRTVLFLAVPATVGLVILRLPIVQLIYQYGEFTLLDAQATAWALLFFGLGLVSHSVVEIITRAFYALHDTRTPVLVGGGAMLLNVVLSLLLIRVIGEPGNLARGPFAGLALANMLATTLEGGLLLVLIRPRVGGLEARRTVAGLSRTIASSVVMGAAIWFLPPVVARWGQVLGPLAAITVGGIVFIACASLLRAEEISLFVSLLLRRLSQK